MLHDLGLLTQLFQLSVHESLREVDAVRLEVVLVALLLGHGLVTQHVVVDVLFKQAFGAQAHSLQLYRQVRDAEHLEVDQLVNVLFIIKEDLLSADGYQRLSQEQSRLRHQVVVIEL